MIKIGSNLRPRVPEELPREQRVCAVQVIFQHHQHLTRAARQRQSDELAL